MEKQKRKAISISTSEGQLVALCDDGTIWRFVYNPMLNSLDPYWFKEIDIPSDHEYKNKGATK